MLKDLLQKYRMLINGEPIVKSDTLSVKTCTRVNVPEKSQEVKPICGSLKFESKDFTGYDLIMKRIKQQTEQYNRFVKDSNKILLEYMQKNRLTEEDVKKYGKCQEFREPSSPHKKYTQYLQRVYTYKDEFIMSQEIKFTIKGGVGYLELSICLPKKDISHKRKM